MAYKRGCEGQMTFNVIITETRSKRIEIEAQTEDEAISLTEKRYLGGEIVLSNDDFEDANYILNPAHF
jgi:hypothetical protein